MKSSTRSNSRSPNRTQRRATAPKQRQDRPDAKQAREVIKRQAVSFELIEGQKSSTVSAEVRLVIEPNVGPPTMIVMVTVGQRAIAALRLPEPPNVLNIFRLFQFVTMIRKVNVDETPLLAEAIHEGALPEGREFKKFRKNVREAFESARSFVPNEKDVLQALAHCHEFGITVDTVSLSALAAEGRFTVTPELEASGVMPPVAYRERRLKIDARVALVRREIEVMCQSIGLPVDELLPDLRTDAEYGLSDDGMVFAAAASIISRLGQGPSLVLTPHGLGIAMVDVLGSAKEFVKTYAHWGNERRVLLAQREYMGYCLHRRSGAKALETCDL